MAPQNDNESGRVTAKQLAARWELKVKHALYRKDGTWYHHLDAFPGALLDEAGYVLFETEAAYQNCKHLQLGKEVGVPGGIRSIPEYVHVGIDGTNSRVFIANFGLENYLWPECKRRPSVATFESEDLRPFWLNNNREGYIAHCIATKRTAAGITPTVPVASRWFNLAHIISETDGDLWIHREKDELWWTVSLPAEVQVSLEPAHKPETPSERVYVLHKPTRSWSNKDSRGAPIHCKGLHARAREILFTESTLQQLSPDNAAYAVALIHGGDLSRWHSSPRWTAKAQAAKKGAVRNLSAIERAVARMASTARATVAGAKGQEVLRTVKFKDLRFEAQAFDSYIRALVDSQGGICAVTGLRLEFDGEQDDDELLCSLDRIDSNKHYEKDNLQVVCKFVNRWKNASDDAEFRRLVRLVRTIENST